MKKIKLTQGEYAVVDDSDFEWLNSFRWHVTSHKYAKTQKNKKKLYMHRLVNRTPKGVLTDHINGDTLDNRKCNLRVADKRINSINRGLQSNNSSGYKGVSWDRNRWAVYIWHYGKKINLGRFIGLSEAIDARKQGEKTYYGL